MAALTAFVGDSVLTLEILAADAEIARISVNQHCGLDRPQAGMLGAALAGESEHGGVRLGHRDTTEAGGGSQIARTGQHCGLDRPGAGVLGSVPGWRVGALRCPTRTQGCHGGWWRESEWMLAVAGRSAIKSPEGTELARREVGCGESRPCCLHL
ncbi:hypothetical protein NDU88_006874 [Pleurodeles waltl]|uniref:Uncharacterized protein n=1 Tax=Pleurodeles waltl TaxID=8319 RepID=A0AAV7RQ72_PLEWA|nr:hypothetical protein NDU88_006874 [Pleurodeles waltl]